MAQAAAPTRKPPAGRPTRWALFRQAFVSFAAVLGGYWMYWFLVVPLIEPNVEQQLAQQQVTEEQIGRARSDISRRQRELAQYFQPDDWEAKAPKFFNSGQMRVLFGDVITQPDGTVELKPCTLMFFPKETAAEPARPIVMRTAKATLRFDQKIETKTVDFKDRRFLGGQIEGVVRIVQRESAPGKGDDLEITTSGVLLDSQRIYTPENVNFRMGRSRGIGRDLEIRLVSDDRGAQGAAVRGLGVQSLQLKRDVSMSLVMGDGPLAGDAAQAQPGQAPAVADTIQITCAGMFEFDMAQYSAAFHQKVNVFRLDPKGGEGDQLNCELLTVFFARPGEARPEPQPAGAPPSRSAASQVRLIEARGNPVTMRSPTQSMYARCSGVDYLPGLAGEPGSLVAFGPGVIHGNLPDDPAGKYTASWARELRFEPDGPLYRAGLHGATTINIGQMGEITADEVFAWLSKQPKPAGQGGHVVGYQEAPSRSPLPGDVWQIERVLARRYQGEAAAQSQNPVHIKSPQLIATTDSLEANVVRPAAPAPGAPSEAAPGGDPPAAAPQPATDPRRAPQNPDEKFLVGGGSVRLELVPAGEQLAIAGVTIEHNAQLEQRSTAGGLDKRLLLVKGSRLHVTDAQTPATRITISGNPGVVEADGMSLWGGAIELEKISNRLWIDGPGGLKLPIMQDLDGKPLARAQALTVDWKQGMNFQTATAVFKGAVVARSSQQVLNTETLEVTLNRPIDFSNPNLNAGRPNERLDASALLTRGWTFLEGRQLDEQGQQTSLSQMGVNDLSIDRTSGEIAGTGPGWVRHVAQGAPQALAPPGAAKAAAPAEAKPGDDKLTYLHVNFRKGLSGNLDKRNVKFFDQTKTVYGPVKDWSDQLNGNDLASLGPSGMLLEADALEIREMGSRPQSKRGYFELDAVGSVSADGERFTALGDRLTYAEQNDQLALRGEPSAELYVNDEAGGERREVRARLVQYWFKDQRVGINGATNFVMPLPQNTSRPRTPAATGASTNLPPTLGAPPTVGVPR